MRRFLRLLGIGVGAIVLLGAAAVYSMMPPASRPAKPIRIEGGQLQGLKQGKITIYRGIPYAAPPIGNLRWRAPQRPATWNGTQQATAFRSSCMQPPIDTGPLAVGPTSEDCLYLNVWTPAQFASKELPVMVWLHGGGNSSGSGSSPLYDGRQLAERGVIVVTLNYRLLALGLLAHPGLTQESGYGASGNYHLLDVIAALQWIQRNIAAFGGDPANVTLFGHSAGAYIESQLMISPLAKGLFQRVIGQSGGAFSPSGPHAKFPLRAEAEQIGAAYAGRFGVHSITELRQVPAERFVAADMASTTPAGVSGTNRMSVDGYVIPDDVFKLYEKGAHHDVDILVGYAASEGATTTKRPSNASQYVSDVRQRYGPLAARFLALYPGSTDDEAARSNARLATEDFAWRAATWARLHARAGKDRVFLYEFSRVPPFAPFKQARAAGHGAELGYVFGSIPSLLFYVMESPWQAYRDAQITRQVQQYWTNFAKTGDPNAEGLPRWPRFMTGEEKILNIGDTTAAEGLPRRNEHDLMSAYYNSLY